MQDSEVEELQLAAKTVFWRLKRAGKLPVRLNTEEYEDAISEAFIEAFRTYSRYDPSRGTVLNFFYLPMAHAILRFAWKQASVGITGDHGYLNVDSLDDAQESESDYEADIEEEAESTYDASPWGTPLGLGNPETELIAFETTWKRLHNNKV